jgi:hypothetical protein
LLLCRWNPLAAAIEESRKKKAPADAGAFETAEAGEF